LTNFELVKEFHRTYNLPLNDVPQLAGDALRDLRMGLIGEECGELISAVTEENIVEIADALTDLLYVVYGMGIVYGIDLDACFKEVHQSNMSKLGVDGKPIYREDGKVLKGPNFREPNLKRVLNLE
jgi:predicted HAD superfamily Cof-like phosphohydrolase